MKSNAKTFAIAVENCIAWCGDVSRILPSVKTVFLETKLSKIIQF